MSFRAAFKSSAAAITATVGGPQQNKKLNSKPQKCVFTPSTPRRKCKQPAVYTGLNATKGESPGITDFIFGLYSATGPLVRLLDPETAHKFAVWSFAHGLGPSDSRPDPESLKVSLWGKSFSNPLGLAAGFDKNAECMEGMLRSGFGFVEIGSVTPQPQPGNPLPRVFRLPEHGAVINRYGFNSEGVEFAHNKLDAYQQRLMSGAFRTTGLLGVNLGKNKLTEDAAADYVIGVEKLGRFADFLVINISSPNTPGLRALQGRQQLADLIARVKAKRDSMPWPSQGPPPLLVKIAPDLNSEDLVDIAAVALDLKVDGLIVSNTSITRPGPIADHEHGKEAGGLSGPPIFAMSTAVLREVYKLTGGKIPIVGCGGISNGLDAYVKIRNGASLVEVYTQMIYQGPAIVPKIKRELAHLLERDGFKSVQEAVGADVPEVKKGVAAKQNVQALA